MSENRSRGSGEDPSAPVELRVFRIKAGRTVIFRALGDDLGGIFVHWERGRSRYCSPDRCGPSCRRKARFWKGYVAGQIWVDETEVWWPVVLEVTEAGGLDLDGQLCRGAVIELSRGVDHRGKKSPVRAKVIDYEDPKDWPPAFGVHATLLHLYHEEEMVLDVPIPLPPRPMADVSKGEAKTRETASEKPAKVSFAEMRKKLAERNGTAKMVEEMSDGDS